MSRNGDFTWKFPRKNLHGAKPNGYRRKRLHADGTGCSSITSCRRMREWISIFWLAKAGPRFHGTHTEAPFTADRSKRREFEQKVPSVQILFEPFVKS